MKKSLPKILFILFTVLLLRGECWGSNSGKIESWGDLFETLLSSKETKVAPVSGTNAWSVNLHQGTFDENWEDIKSFFTSLSEKDPYHPATDEKGPRVFFSNTSLGAKTFSNLQRGSLETLLRGFLEKEILVYASSNNSLAFQADLEEKKKKGPTVIKLANVEEVEETNSQPIKLPPNGLDMQNTAAFMLYCVKIGVDHTYLQVEQDTGKTYKNGIITEETEHEVYIEPAAQAYMASLSNNKEEELKQIQLAQAAYKKYCQGTLPKGMTNPVIVVGRGFMGVRANTYESELSPEEADEETSERLRKALAQAGVPNPKAYVGKETGKVYIPDVDPSQIALIQKASKLFMYGEGEINLEAQLKVFQGIKDLKAFFEKGAPLPSSFRFADLPENIRVQVGGLENTLNAMMEDLETLRGEKATEGDFVKALNELQKSITVENAVAKAKELEALVDKGNTDETGILVGYKKIAGQLETATDQEVKLESLKMFVQQLKEIRCMSLMGIIQTCGPLYNGLSKFGRLNTKGDIKACSKWFTDSLNTGLDVVPLGMLDDPDYTPKKHLLPTLEMLKKRADKALGQHKDQVLRVRKAIKEVRQQFATLGLEEIGTMIEIMMTGFQRIEEEFPTAESIPSELLPLAEEFKKKKEAFLVLKKEVEGENHTGKLEKVLTALNSFDDLLNFKNVNAAREYVQKNRLIKNPSFEQVLKGYEVAIEATKKGREEVAELLLKIKGEFDRMYKEFIEFEYQARQKLQKK